MAALVEPAGPLGCVWIGTPARAAWIVKARAPTEAQRQTLVLSAAAVPWAQRVAPRGAGAGRVAAALAGGWLVLGEDRATLDRSLPYLVRTVARRTRRGPGGGLDVRLAEGAAGGLLRPWLEARLRDWTTRAREAAREERQRRREEPALGEPEVLVAELEQVLLRRLALLPDLGPVQGTLRVEGDALSLELEAELRAARSPLGRALADERPGAAGRLGAAPANAAVAWSSSATARDRAEASDAWVRAGARVAAARAGDPEVASWRRALAELDGALGDARVVALWSDARGARRLGAGFEHGASARVTAALESLGDALAAGYPAQVAGALAGCEPAEPGGAPPGQGGGSTVAHADGDGARALCRAGRPVPAATSDVVLGWSVREGIGALALGESDDDAIAGAGTLRESMAQPGPSSLAGADPDLARWLDAQQDAFAVLMVSPSGLARLWRGRPGALPRDRVSLALARPSASSLRVRLRAPARAVVSTLVLRQLLATD